MKGSQRPARSTSTAGGPTSGLLAAGTWAWPGKRHVGERGSAVSRIDACTDGDDPTSVEGVLKRDEGELRAGDALTSIGDAVVVLDADGRIAFVNPTAQAMTGWCQAEALGEDWSQVCCLLEETRARMESLVQRALSEGSPVHLGVGTVLASKDGREVPVGGSAAPIKDQEGAISGIVLVLHEVSDHMGALEALRQCTAELEADIEQLDTFVQTVAHRLKDPLSTMIGYATLLQRDVAAWSADQRREYACTIARVGFQACNIVDELVLLAAVCHWEGKMDLLHMGSIVARAEKRLRPLVEKNRAEIVLPDGWPAAYAYAPWVEEVWVNYLSNGIQYGGHPPVLELGGSAGPAGMARFWVRDNGGGIAPEDQACLFSPFTGLHQVRTAGYGLGLPVVRRIVEKLGGQVGLVSQVGEGSTFFFTLPAFGTAGAA